MESSIEYNNYNMVDEAPMSRTHQYRKVMKPLLERRRRARINKCLDDLKDLMVSALQSEGESITKLEKADVLELTVRHLQKLKRQQMLQANPALDIDRFRAGYSSCASEVSRFLASVPGVKIHLGTQLMSHLGVKMNAIERVAAVPLSVSCPTSSLSRPQMSLSPSSDGGYTSGRESSPSPALSVGCPSPAPQVSTSSVWRPF
jgi:hairy-and-enhancer-of-split protein